MPKPDHYQYPKIDHLESGDMSFSSNLISWSELAEHLCSELDKDSDEVDTKLIKNTVALVGEALRCAPAGAQAEVLGYLGIKSGGSSANQNLNQFLKHEGCGGQILFHKDEDVKAKGAWELSCMTCHTHWSVTPTVELAGV